MDRNMGKTQETIARDARVVEMFRAGKSIKEIALAVGRRKTTVAQVIKDFLREEADEDEDAPLPPRPKGFGAVKAPKLKIPPLEHGKLYSLPEFCDKNRSGGRRPPARIMQFIGFVPGAGVRHALFLHPVAGYRESFREFDLQRVRRVS